ncbi:hypothetical protein [Fodinicola acaciae]|uniref:hypothetical protein n=1 Tax=Fodinicola acaciae TaxID=2681555 RepID=UPI0013D6707B|nr:hypothetical protein [Fodinicola acaciae]
MESATPSTPKKKTTRRATGAKNEYARRAAKEIRAQLKLIADAGNALAAVEAAEARFEKAKAIYTKKYEAAAHGVSETVLDQSGLPDPAIVGLSHERALSTSQGKPADIVSTGTVVNRVA